MDQEGKAYHTPGKGLKEKTDSGSEESKKALAKKEKRSSLGGGSGSGGSGGGGSRGSSGGGGSRSSSGGGASRSSSGGGSASGGSISGIAHSGINSRKEQEISKETEKREKESKESLPQYEENTQKPGVSKAGSEMKKENPAEHKKEAAPENRAEEQKENLPKEEQREEEKAPEEGKTPKEGGALEEGKTPEEGKAPEGEILPDPEGDSAGRDQENGNKDETGTPGEEPKDPGKEEAPIGGEDSAEPKDPAEVQRENAQKVWDNLSTGRNTNLAQYEDPDSKEIKTILWAEGITPPQMGEGGDFVKEEHQGYETYKCEYQPNQGWYDVNKSLEGEMDRSLCFAAVSSNMLHWWLEQNADEVGRFIQKEKNTQEPIKEGAEALRDIRHFVDSFKNQQKSHLFEMYVLYYGSYKNGFLSDLLIDQFINGYKPKNGGGTNTEWSFTFDEKGGFFYPVFKEKKLTDRPNVSGYDALSRQVKNRLMAGEIFGLVHSLAYNSEHIVTVWGAEFDSKGKLSAVYVTDSDDQGENGAGMKRLDVNNVGGQAKLSTYKRDKNVGSKVSYMHSLSLGKEQWENYFESAE